MQKAEAEVEDSLMHLLLEAFLTAELALGGNLSRDSIEGF